MAADSGIRSYTFVWHDDVAAQAMARNLSGRDYLEALRRGELPPPPFAALLGFRLDEVGDGRVIFSCEPREFMYNGIGLIHGGVAAAMFDTAVGCACLSVTPADKVAVTMDLHVRYLRPLTMRSGRISCTGTVINAGRTTVTTEGRLTDAAGRLCGHATATLALVDPAGSR